MNAGSGTRLEMLARRTGPVVLIGVTLALAGCATNGLDGPLNEHPVYYSKREISERVLPHRSEAVTNRGPSPLANHIQPQAQEENHRSEAFHPPLFAVVDKNAAPHQALEQRIAQPEPTTTRSEAPPEEKTEHAGLAGFWNALFQKASDTPQEPAANTTERPQEPSQNMADSDGSLSAGLSDQNSRQEEPSGTPEPATQESPSVEEPIPAADSTHFLAQGTAPSAEQPETNTTQAVQPASESRWKRMVSHWFQRTGKLAPDAHAPTQTPGQPQAKRERTREDAPDGSHAENVTPSEGFNDPFALFPEKEDIDLGSMGQEVMDAPPPLAKSRHRDSRGHPSGLIRIGNPTEEATGNDLLPETNPARFHPNQGYMIRLGSFASKLNAQQLQERLDQLGLPVVSVPVAYRGRTFLRIFSGPYPNRDAAEQAQRILTEQEGLKGDISPFLLGPTF